MKKRQFISFSLIIILVVSIHIGVFFAYDFYNNSGRTIDKIKNEVKNYSELGKKVQTARSHDNSMKRKYMSNPEPTQTVKSKIYSWVDSSGVKHFSDMGPSEAVSNLKVSELSISDDLGKSELIAQKIDRYPSHLPITRVVIKGNRVFVPVRLGYKGKEVQVMLLLDTGASTTVVHREAASNLNIWDRLKTTSIVADGRKVNTEIAYLDYIQVGPHRLKKFAVSIINYSGDNDHYTGYKINYANGE